MLVIPPQNPSEIHLPWVLDEIIKQIGRVILEDPESLPELTLHSPRINKKGESKRRLRRLESRQNLVKVLTACFQKLDLMTMSIGHYDPFTSFVQPLTLKQIADKAGVSVRTVIRDIQILQHINLQWFMTTYRKPKAVKDWSGRIVCWRGRAAIRTISLKFFARFDLDKSLSKAQELRAKKDEIKRKSAQASSKELAEGLFKTLGRPAARPAEPRAPGLKPLLPGLVQPASGLAQPANKNLYVAALQSGQVTPKQLEDRAAKAKDPHYAATLLDAISTWQNG